jgi:gamma-glutamyltranspeptidase/glutathione hydrolase
MLQALNILENMDLKAMGYNSARYLHAIYQAMNLAFADRDFYYGDPYVPPAEPIKGLLSKTYARDRFKQINWSKNDPDIGPGDPYPYQGEKNPFRNLLERWRTTGAGATTAGAPAGGSGSTGATASIAPAPAVVAAADPARPLDDEFVRHFYAGTTSIEAADDKGWVVSITPSGGWVPAVIAGRTGIGLSQRMQSFVLDPAENPFNVVEPGKHPRVTLTPTLALKDGKPYLSFAVQGGDSQDQNLLQFFLDVVEFGMNVQEACEAPNINSYQMRSSFGAHDARPGKMLINDQLPGWVRSELARMGYSFEVKPRTAGPINAIFFDQPHGTFWGGSSDDADDYGIAW